MKEYKSAEYEKNILENNTFDPSLEEYNLYNDIDKLLGDLTKPQLENLKEGLKKLKKTSVNESELQPNQGTKNYNKTESLIAMRKDIEKYEKRMKEKVSQKKLKKLGVIDK